MSLVTAPVHRLITQLGCYGTILDVGKFLPSGERSGDDGDWILWP